jgi:glycosyltransferase involved in cell wall biosynthesis
MRILHVTNLISPHQLPLARQLAAVVGEGNFRFVATMPMTIEMGRRGWRNDKIESWILRPAENETERLEFEESLNEADVVIAGYRHVDWFSDRLRRGKLTYYMSERWWKPPVGMARLLDPRFALMAASFRKAAKSPDFHYLPMGGYSATDILKIAPFKDRIWNWGYFTDVKDSLPICRDSVGQFRILWAGRMLAWKRVDTLVMAFALFLRYNQNSRLTLIGDGPCREKLVQLARKLDITGNVDFLSSMITAEVRDQMRSAHVYVLPSNGYEGWGAVLNEAMTERCTIVASDAGGAAKSMIRHGENGLVFSPGDYKRLSYLLCQLSGDKSLCSRLAEAGRRTIMEEWSPAIAAERFVAVSEAILAKRSTPSFASGPMARL